MHRVVLQACIHRGRLNRGRRAVSYRVPPHALVCVAPPTQVSREVTAAMIKWDQDGDLLSIITIYGQDPDGDLRRL